MRKLSIALGLVLFVAVVPAASASHPTQLCLDIEREEQYAVSNDDIVDAIRAYPGATDADHPPQHEGCVTQQQEPEQDWSGTEIDFEVTGAGDPDASDSPGTPDFSCSITQGGSCWAYPPEADSGTQTIRGWIDFGNGTDEADLSEGQDEAVEPGETPEPDATDVVLWTWSYAESSVETVIKIAFDEPARMLHGRVRSQYPRCAIGRGIKLFRQRRDRNRKLIATVATDDEGRWEVTDFHPRRGRFYTVAPPTGFDDLVGRINCLRSRSDTLRVESPAERE